MLIARFFEAAGKFIVLRRDAILDVGLAPFVLGRGLKKFASLLFMLHNLSGANYPDIPQDCQHQELS